MQKICLLALVLFFGSLKTHGESCNVSLFKFEGLLSGPVEDINNMNSHAQAFLPYNPVIVEIGAYEGKGTLGLSATYPYGKIFAFEPCPKAYSLLAENMQPFSNVSVHNLAANTFNGTTYLWGDGPQASLLHSQNEESHIDASCVVLDDWCAHQEITHVDFIRLDVGGYEWQILQSSPKVLEKALVIVTKTHVSPSKQSILSYSILKKLLEERGFTMLSHWYQEGGTGEAVFVRKCMYDSIFN